MPHLLIGALWTFQTCRVILFPVMYMRTILVGKSRGVLQRAGWHNHDDWEIVIPTSGSGTVKTETESVPFSAGMLYVMPPGTNHCVESESGFTDMYILVGFPGLRADRITVVRASADLIALANIVLDAYRNREYGRRSALDQAVALIIQLISDDAKESCSDFRILEIRDYLAGNIENQNLDMNILSQHFGYHKDYIRRRFQQYFGMTPMAYLDRLRLSQAKDLLVQMPMYSVETVGMLCGFSDRFYFSRFFKKHTGIAPADFRSREKRRKFPDDKTGTAK